MNARALPVRAAEVPLSLDRADHAVFASADARSAASVALAALTATAAATASATAPVRDFIDDLATVLPIRLTVHQREVLELALTRAVYAIVMARAG